MRCAAICIVIVGLVAGATLAQGQSVPSLINYQGKLTDANGQPHPTGEHQLTFRIWNHPTATAAANKLWQETHAAVPVVGGQFNVILGSITKSPSLTGLFTASVRYISTEVD